MKFSVRQGVFETNSSSTHSITMCLMSDYLKWQRGELVFNGGKLVPIPEGFKPYNSCDESTWDFEDFDTYERYFNRYDLEYYEDSFTTPSGEKVAAFGYYGTDN